MVINSSGGDFIRPFTVFAKKVQEQSPWLNDFVLSPLIPKTVWSGYKSKIQTSAIYSTMDRPDDIRVVVSWVGKQNFNSGFLTPIYLKTNETELCVPGQPCQTILQYGPIESFVLKNTSFKKIAKGINYYTEEPTLGIWYHGLGSTKNKTHAEAFSIDTTKAFGNADLLPSNAVVNGKGLYKFFVHIPENSTGGIQYKTASNLKVEVYYSKNAPNWDYYRRFDKPDKVFYLSNAVPSNNKEAKYWHVFDIIESKDGDKIRIKSDHANAIVSGVKFLK